MTTEEKMYLVLLMVLLFCFWTRAQYFHFALGPEKYVAITVCQFGHESKSAFEFS